MNLIDTHCHLTFQQLSGDIDAVIRRSIDAGVTGWITVGTDQEQNPKAVALAEKFENTYAAIGIHPHDARTVTDEDLENLKVLAENKKVVAIGETGLDFHYNFSTPEEQRRVFIEHLKIAEQLKLPVVIHSREAFDETINILDEFAKGIEKIVFHCFPGSDEQAKMILDRGWFVSFTGVVTFKNAHIVRKAVEAVPIERLMLETDCPYMSPEPMRKQKINEPSLMVHTASFIANLKHIELENFAEIAAKTSKDFFNII